MKKTLLSLAFISLAFYSHAQVGVGTTSPNATLDVVKSIVNTATTRDGVRAPNITKTDLANKNASIYGSDQIGTIVYVTDASNPTGTPASLAQVVNVTAIGYYYFDGNFWQKMSSTAGGDSTNDAWVNNAAGTRVELGTLSNGTTARTTLNNVVVTDAGRIGVGVNVPDAGIHVVGDNDGWKDDIRLDSYSGSTTTAPAANFRFYGARGTSVTPSTVLDGDTLGQFNFWYHNGTSFATGAKISSNYKSTLGSNLIFSTGGASNNTLALTETGKIGVSTQSPSATFDVAKSTVNPTTTPDGVRAPNITKTELANKVASTYGAAHTGTMVYVTDATGGTTGASLAQVPYIKAAGYYTFDGTTWQPIAGAVQKIVGTMRPANSAILLLDGSNGGTTTNGTITLGNTAASVDKIHLGSYIDLPPGKWEVEANVLVNLGLPGNVAGLNYIFNKFTFTEETTATVTNQSGDLPPTSQSGWLIGGSTTIFGSSSGSTDYFYAVINGKVFITNTSSATKRYYLVLWQGSRKYSNYQTTTLTNGIQTASASISMTNLGSSANGENYISAMRIQ